MPTTQKDPIGHKRRIGVAILGFGTVGQGVFHLLSEESTIQSKHGIGFDVRKILVRDVNSAKHKTLPKSLLTTDIKDITDDPMIDIVVEVIGGVSPASEYISKCFKAGKNVVTANKKLMGLKGEDLVARARQYQRYFGFAAAITGCHQLARSVVSSVMVRSIAGVFNGTSNYILTKMEGGLSFADALKEAQLAGYAEADPSEDVSGSDTCNKLVIMSKLAFGTFLDRDQIPIEGIERITREDMLAAEELGYTIKLLGISRLTEESKIEARVQPCLVSKSNLLASVKGVDNGIQVYDVLRGVQGMVASGAGSRPTAMAIFGDLISMVLNDPITWPTDFTRRAMKYVKTSATVAKYYVRVQVENHPGVLAAVTKIFGRHEINIISLLQHGESQGDPLPLVFMCGPAQARTMEKAVTDLNGLESVKEPAIIIRVEDELTPIIELLAA